MRVFDLTAASLILALGASTAALAHAKLVSSTPAANGAAPAGGRSLDLMFSEEISSKLSGATVKGSDGKNIPSSAMTMKGGKGMMVMLKQPMVPGAYTVDWHAVASDDGHKATGTYTFTAK